MRIFLAIIKIGLVVLFFAACKKDEESVLTNQIGTVKDVDGNVYNTVTIGTQVWMASNLKSTKYKDGTAIPFAPDNTAWENLATPGYCWYNNQEAANKNTYGALYNWYTVKTGKLCPTGWHVPSDYEWSELTYSLDGPDTAGGKLKETGSSHWANPNTGATNTSGFFAVPGGRRILFGTFNDMGNFGYWWTSVEYISNTGVYFGMHYNSADVSNNYIFKRTGLAVRCLRD